MKALFDHTFLYRVLQSVKKEMSVHEHRTIAEPPGQLTEIKPTEDDKKIRSFLN